MFCAAAFFERCIAWVRKNAHDAQNADNAGKNTAFPPVCKKCAKVCRAPEKGKSHEESYDSSWDFGALEGTRIPGPLIKRAYRAEHFDFRSFEFTLFLRKASWFSARQFLRPLSYFASQSTHCIPWNRAKTVHLLWDKWKIMIFDPWLDGGLSDHRSKFDTRKEECPLVWGVLRGVGSSV